MQSDMCTGHNPRILVLTALVFPRLIHKPRQPHVFDSLTRKLGHLAEIQAVVSRSPTPPETSKGSLLCKDGRSIVACTSSCAFDAFSATLHIRKELDAVFNSRHSHCHRSPLSFQEVPGHITRQTLFSAPSMHHDDHHHVLSRQASPIVLVFPKRQALCLLAWYGTFRRPCPPGVNPMGSGHWLERHDT